MNSVQVHSVVWFPKMTMFTNCLTLFIIVTISAISSINASPRRAAVDCTDHKAEIDKLANNLYVVIDRSIPLPKSEPEMQQVYCTQSKAASKKLRKLQACLKPFAGQVLNVILSGVRKSLRNICDTVEARQEFVDRSLCLRKTEVKEKIENCYNHYILEMEHVRDNITEMDLKVPYTCCYYWRARSCILNLIKDKCPLSSLEYTQRYVDETFADTTDLLCHKWDVGSLNCREKLPPIILKPEAKKQSLSFVLPNLEIYSQIATQP